MTFPQKNLHASETIVLDMHPHWWYFAEAVLALLGAIVVGIVVLSITDSGSGARKGGTWLDLVLLVIGAVWLIARYLKWITTEFVVTSHRVIFRQGLIGKSGIEIPLERVNNVNFHQGVFERLLGAGDLLIESGGEDGQQRFTDIRHPDRVQNLINSQMDQLAVRRSGVAGGSAPAADFSVQLERLEGMLQRGTLTQEEFETQKRRLLG
jgi:uncharacterized membrane protein YdbT with pleckstrin-like domain